MSEDQSKASPSEKTQAKITDWLHDIDNCLDLWGNRKALDDWEQKRAS